MPSPSPAASVWTIICAFLIPAVRPYQINGAALPVRTTPNIEMRGGADAPTFKIALFADLHFGENAWTGWGPLQDLNSIRVMSNVLDDEQPDFVIYLGDIITANNIMVNNASLYWEQALSPTKARRIPWSSIFGNHDDAAFVWPMEWFSQIGIPKIDCPAANDSLAGSIECSIRGTTRLELLRSEIQQNSLSYTQGGPQSLWPSISNYVLNLSLTSDTSETVLYMYFFDSGGGSYPKVVSNAQVKWFQKKSEEINPDLRVPEVIFWHIPSEAYKTVAPNQSAQGTCVGSIFLEDVAAQEAEMGMMNVLEQRPSVKAVFVGHNHGLDWCCPYKSLWLCFARHTGYGGYGSWPRGARILEINRQPFSLKSWIRMEDGQVHSEVLLSS